MKKTMHRSSATALVASLAIFASSAWAQQAPTPAATKKTPAAPTTAAVTAAAEERESVITLTPFEVAASADTGYGAVTTLAGNRLNTDLRDIGNAVTVITAQFMKDIGATSNETLLQYTVGTEVGNIQGNFTGVGDSASLNESGRFANPNQNTRVRGLTAADNTRDFFLTDIPWDGYAVDRVELQRGANSILFGQGSPAGIINTGTKQATFKNTNEAEARFGSFGTFRTSLDMNRVLLKNQLSFRVLGLYNDEKFQQDPAYNLDKRLYSAFRYEPAFLKKAPRARSSRATSSSAPSAATAPARSLRSTASPRGSSPAPIRAAISTARPAPSVTSIARRSTRSSSRTTTRAGLITVSSARASTAVPTPASPTPPTTPGSVISPRASAAQSPISPAPAPPRSWCPRFALCAASARTAQ